MERKSFGLNDIVEMKKPHPCGTNSWKVIRMGMDIRMKCTGCGHSVLLPRSRFKENEKSVSRRITAGKGSGRRFPRNFDGIRGYVTSYEVFFLHLFPK